MVAEHPFFGVGLENFDTAFSPHMPPELLVLEEPTNYADSSHNFFFDLLVQTGIFGTLAFAGFLIAFFVMFLRQHKTTWLQKSLVSSLVAILVSWQFGFPGIVDAVMFFAVIGLLSHQ